MTMPARKLFFASGQKSSATPLEFAGGFAASTLSHWPRHHIAKCLLPEVSPESRDLQDARLAELHSAAAMYGIELLIELVRDDSQASAASMAQRIGAVQENGILPDWWKLPAFSDPDAWPAIANAIHSRNPLCRGVLVVGRGRDFDELQEEFGASKRQPITAGFAVGSSFFQDAAASWLAGEHDDAEFKSALSARFKQLAAWWRDAA
jgi:5-dehydro-2-deoxygluconokinase